MARYKKAIRRLFRLEGHESDHDADPGGKTRFGISKVYWPEYWEDGPPTKEEAYEFWHKEFCEPLQLTEIHDQRIANELLEQAANLGKERAVKLCQFAVNLVDPSPGEIAVDGVMGPETVGALNRLIRRDTFRWLKVANGLQFAYYLYRVGKDDVAEEIFQTTPDESQQVFFRGWMRRIFEDEGLT